MSTRAAGSLLLAMAMASGLVACGQKGPLTLSKPAASAAAAAASTASK